MSKRCLKIPPDEIDVEDDTFRSSIQRDLGPLQNSIKSVGLLIPPRVQPMNGRYRVVSGFLRVEACRFQGLKEIEVVVLGREAREDTIFLQTIHENRFTRGFNWAEQAWTLQRFVERWNWSEDRVIDAAMPALGMTPAPKLLEDYLRLASMDTSVKQEMLRHGASVANALRLARWCANDQRAFVSLLDRLHLGENLMREFLELVEEISLRERISPGEFLQSREVIEIVHDEIRDRPWRTNALRSFIRQRRYPNFASMESAFKEARSRLGLPREISVQPSPFFESRVVTVSFRARTKEEMRGLCKKIWEASQREGHLDMLFRAMDELPCASGGVLPSSPSAGPPPGSSQCGDVAPVTTQ